MRFFNFEKLKAAADCEAVAAALGLKVQDHRCAATWRGATNPTAVSLTRDAWCDFGDNGRGGSAIDLVAVVRFGGDVQQAQEWLGEHLGLKPDLETVPNPVGIAGTHYERLIESGYREICRYDYTDARGQPVFQVIRLHHPEKGKEFLQQAADGRWTVKHCPPVLYNLPGIATSDWAIIVEGEKDANTLRGWDLPATCNPGGSSKWRDEYTEFLANKDIVVILDNDPAGQNHGSIVAGALAGKVKSIRMLTPSKLPKGDITDWVEQEGGTREQFMAMIQAARPLDQSRLDESYALALAKEANRTPLRNFLLVWEKGKGIPRKDPRHVTDLIGDVRTRFLGFPRKVGESLFDHDRETGRIVFMDRPAQFFAWIQRKSGQVIEWTGGSGMIPKEEFYAGIHAAADRYESVSSVPDWPRRADVYYSHGPLPAPSPDRADLEKLIGFFNPVSEADRCILRSLVCTPIFYEPGVGRPMFVIDAERPGSGKTSLACLVAELYGHAPVEVKTRDFARDMQEVTKRLVSTSGRQARVLLIDNVTGVFRSEELSALITMPSITGRPSYGHGEESRPNNLTYVITANNATIDNDLSIRSCFIQLKTPAAYSPRWNRSVRAHIAERRLHIFADIIDLLGTHHPFAATVAATRYPEWEEGILQPCCGSDDAYGDTIKHLANLRADANIDEENGGAVEEALRHHISALGIHPDEKTVFIRSAVVDRWLHTVLPDCRGGAGQMVRNLAREGHLPRVHPSLRIWPHHGQDRRRGIMWLRAGLERTDTPQPDWCIILSGENVERRAPQSASANPAHSSSPQQPEF